MVLEALRTIAGSASMPTDQFTRSIFIPYPEALQVTTIWYMDLEAVFAVAVKETLILHAT